MLSTSFHYGSRLNLRLQLLTLFSIVSASSHDLTEETRLQVKDTSQDVKDLARFDNTTGVRLTVRRPKAHAIKITTGVYWNRSWHKRVTREEAKQFRFCSGKYRKKSNTKSYPRTSRRCWSSSKRFKECLQKRSAILWIRHERRTCAMITSKCGIVIHIQSLTFISMCLQRTHSS